MNSVKAQEPSAAEHQKNAETDFRMVLKAIERLKTTGCQGSYQQHVAQLASEFQLVAERYCEIALRTIEAEKGRQNDLNDAYYYHRCVERLRAHVTLLGTICHAPPPPIDQAAVETVRLLIAGIKTRFSRIHWLEETVTDQPFLQPVLIAVPMRKFVYFDFTYMKGIGAIGVPYSSWMIPGRDLSVLWHEVGGYAVAMARRNGTLRTWASHLAASLKGQNRTDKDALKGSTLWDYYRGEFEQSDLSKRSVGISVYSDFVRVTESFDIRAYFMKDPPSKGGKRAVSDTTPYPASDESLTVDTDQRWQMAWFGEFFEDLFGVEALGTAMFEILAEVLVREGKKGQLGDRSHPPAALRLQVILEYLKNRYEHDDTKDIAEVNNSVEEMKRRYGGRLGKLQPPQSQLQSDFRETARIIAGYYCEIHGVAPDAPCLALDPEEKKAADLYLQILKNAEYQQGGSNPQQPEASQNTPVGAVESGGDLCPSCYVWEQAEITKEELDDGRNIGLERLEKIKIVETDETPIDTGEGLWTGSG